METWGVRGGCSGEMSKRTLWMLWREEQRRVVHDEGPRAAPRTAGQRRVQGEAGVMAVERDVGRQV